MVEQRFRSVEEYIAAFPDDVRPILATIREIVRRRAPEAVESISYHMPTYSLQERPLVFFAGWKTHAALYAVPPFDGELEDELAPFRAAKDTVKFSYRKPLPEDLIGRVVDRLLSRRSA